MTSTFFNGFQQQFEVLPERLGGHIALSLAALTIGIVVSIPLGIYASRNKRLELAAMISASLIQTIPSLALLALMVFLWGTIGWIPALIAMVLYSILPILRNTIIGLQSVDPAVIEAAKGIGMTERQMLWWVQMPLAASTILAGIRTAAVWVVGLATIAEPVGATSLGNYIFVGLQTSNSLALLFGCFFSALLALILDGVLRRMQNAMKDRDRNRLIRLGCVLILVFISPLLLALTKSSPKQLTQQLVQTTQPEENRPWVIGSKAFTEQYILEQVIKTRLTQAGLTVEEKEGMGSVILFDALKKGEVDCYVDYSGTLWATILKKDTVESGPETLIDVATELKKNYGIVTLGTLGFENSYAFAMRRSEAQRLNIKSIDDLAKQATHIRAGTEIEFFARPEWERVRTLYGMDFGQKTTMDATLMYGAIQNKQLDLIVAFSTDGRIAAYDLTVLDDPRQALPPYDAVILLSPRAARNPTFVHALRPLLNAISTEKMRMINKRVDLDKVPFTQASKELLDSLNR